MRVEDLEQREDGLIDIAAHVIVERKSQKGIVIGKGGSLLKLAGTEARADLERLLGNRVNLSLHVTVETGLAAQPSAPGPFRFHPGLSQASLHGVAGSARSESLEVIPPSEWVDRRRVTLFQRMSMSG